MKKTSENYQSNQLSIYQVSEIQISYHPKFSTRDRPIINNSQLAYEIFFDHWNMDTIELQEEFKMILLNRQKKVLGLINLSCGGMSSTIIDPKLVFATALKACASSILLAHSHPSGNTQPSEEDKEVTKKLIQAGQFLDLHINDHLIITKDEYFSFADERLM